MDALEIFVKYYQINYRLPDKTSKKGLSRSDRYEKLKQTIEANFEASFHESTSTWIIKARNINEDSEKILNDINGCIDTDMDFISIVGIVPATIKTYGIKPSFS